MFDWNLAQLDAGINTLVMGGGVAVGIGAFFVAKKQALSYLGQPTLLPVVTSIDKRLVFGSLIFGAGWGLTGFCPGPAMVSLAFGNQGAYVFVIAMLTGMVIFDYLDQGFRRS